MAPLEVKILGEKLNQEIELTFRPGGEIAVSGGPADLSVSLDRIDEEAKIKISIRRVDLEVLRTSVTGNEFPEEGDEHILRNGDSLSVSERGRNRLRFVFTKKEAI